MAEQNGFIKFSSSEELLPQEEMLEIKNKNSSLTIGIPKESNTLESRVCLVPGAVHLLTQNGHRVLLQSNAGKASQFEDVEYSEAGAEIVQHAEEVFKADIILKVDPLSDKELKMIKSKQVILSSLCINNHKVDYFKKMIEMKSTSVAFEQIQDKSEAFPVLRSMSKIVGNTAIMIAAEYLSSPEYGKAKMLGGFPGIKPTNVVIIGAGTVAENAARTALGMGAIVKIFDNSIYKLERLQNTLNNRIFTSIIQPKFLMKELKSADVVIGAIHSATGMTPCVVTEEMIQKMKPGSIIIDVSIDQGGCFETSRITDHKNPVFKKFGITHYCVPNMASRVPNTASYAFSNFFTPVLLKIGTAGGFESFLKQDKGLRQGVYMLNGTLTNKLVGDLYNLPYKEISLLMAAMG